ncbi:ATP-dependent RNA helicase HrpA [Permianibacter sp. IMCC34836]|uniref:ATP-dependent RNA helicase HrpA n=1 Tax=Permianibacter fluminis TaxID=2738515 RepID=UPI001557F7F8|nr:ATP-dependent RNA helicase HrpA [Permianibacter fluminis]NQD38859.1 ATP-dependent RNA helicase HrpA [Permianibacter fluminis]
MTELNQWRAALPTLMRRDHDRLARQLDKLALRIERKQPHDRDLAAFTQALSSAQERVQQRAARVPELRYDEILPIVQARAELREAIAAHQVVVIAGETGSGKTTQIPKICLELGRGTRGLIGHTQPRRLAATSVARRIAQELQVPLGQQVGYAIRFDQQCSDDSLIAVMTDGVLLQELKNDPLLTRYDTLIIDEAHERSLNIDLLLGYLKTILPQRPDLKLIITSATIDPESFARFFAIDGHDAPVHIVSGRTYPVETRYRPLVGEVEDERTLPEGVLHALDELWQEGPGDVLVFLSGEGEIREVTQFLRKQQFAGPMKNVELLPLYARLSMADQNRVFASGNKPRVILATNVAETSLTVPGIRYVIDSGLARISRYSQSSRVQRLPIEAISQASANQRSGRCGRVMSGVCIRLYAEDDFVGRDEFTSPEILRTNLSALILHMLSLGLRDIENFPFVEAPDRKRINDGLRLLIELGAVTTERELTVAGRQMAALPLPPQLSRILIAAAKERCLKEALIITSFLCIRDPRERPQEKQDQAVGLHRRFNDPESDFLAILNLWHYVHKRKEELSSSAWRKALKAEFLNVLAIIEWGRMVAHLKLLAQELFGVAALHAEAPRKVAEETGDAKRADSAPLLVKEGTGVVKRPQEKANTKQTHTTPNPSVERSGANTSSAKAVSSSTATTAIQLDETGKPIWPPVAYDPLHRALLHGLLHQIGNLTRDGDYQGPRNIRFVPHGGSGLGRKGKPWVMAADFLDSTRLYGLYLARIEPVWLEQIAAHLTKVTHSEPHWREQRGDAAIHESVSLFGLVLVPRRAVALAKIDPAKARELFIRHVLIRNESELKAGFQQHNQRLFKQQQEQEEKARRRDLLLAEDDLLPLFEARLPSKVLDKHSLIQALKQDGKLDTALRLTAEDVAKAGAIGANDYPPELIVDELLLPLKYSFAPGEEYDGVTARVPVTQLAALSPLAFERLVPGLLEAKVEALLRGLPKDIRKQLQPLAESAHELTVAVRDDSKLKAIPLFDALSDALYAAKRMRVPAAEWGAVELEAFLRMRFEVLDSKGKVLGSGRDLLALQKEFVQAASQGLRSSAKAHEQEGLREFPASAIAEQLSLSNGVLYLALTDAGDTVAVRAYARADEARWQHRAGIRRLLALQLDVDFKNYIRQNKPVQAMQLAAAAFSQSPSSADAKGSAPSTPLLGKGEAGRTDSASALSARVAPDALSSGWAGRGGVGAGQITVRPQQSSKNPSSSVGASGTAFLSDWLTAAIDANLPANADTIRDASSFRALLLAAPARVRSTLAESLPLLAETMQTAAAARAKANKELKGKFPDSVKDLDAALAELFAPGFLLREGLDRLRHLRRYAEAAKQRLERMQINYPQEAKQLALVQVWQSKIRDALKPATPWTELAAAQLELARLWQEYRVACFAQTLGTDGPVSEKRLEKQLELIKQLQAR